MYELSRRRILALAIAAGAALPAGAALADDYPAKPITMIIPLGAGGSHDLNARVMTSVLPSYLGQPVVVELMPGGSGRIGTAAAAKAKPDGYTLLFTHNFIDELQQHVSKLPYDPNKDFVVGRAHQHRAAIAGRCAPTVTSKRSRKCSTTRKANPGKVKFGHSGNWGAAMVPGAVLLQAAGVKMSLVPYKGGGPAMRGVLSGDVDFTVAFPSVITSQGDKVRTLVDARRQAIFPDVPTTGEIGYPGCRGYRDHAARGAGAGRHAAGASRQAARGLRQTGEGQDLHDLAQASSARTTNTWTPRNTRKCA